VVDRRLYAKICVDLPSHPKIKAVGGAAAWLHICAILYARQYKLDGVIDLHIVKDLTDAPRPSHLVRKLFSSGLWHDHGHFCESCPEVLPGFFVIHDYLEHQPSRSEIAHIQGVRSEAGRKGGRPRKSKLLSDSFHSEEATPSRTEKRDKENPPYPPASGGSDGSRKKTPSQCKYDYAADPGFLEFWAAFPVKAGKPKSYEAWRHAVDERGADPAKIIMAAARYRDDPLRNPTKTKYPQGWLNDERYDAYDEPDAMPQQQRYMTANGQAYDPWEEPWRNA
jgi:hypothetical protein